MALNPEILIDLSVWQTEGNLFLAGFSWHEEEFTAGQTLISLFRKKCRSFHEFSTFCKTLNGRFSVIVDTTDEIWIHTCHTWSFPVFYEISGTQVRITDRPETLLPPTGKLQTHEDALVYFVYFGVTPGSSTLHAPVAVSQPGESICISLKSGRISKDREAWHVVAGEPLSTEKLGANLRAIFSKYAKSLENKRVLLPLTRGYDSRLLGCLLREAGHENVLCATWGREGNPEAGTAARVAERLGYEHIFIPYTSEMISGFTREPGFEKYIALAGHFTSMPYLQDYFAVKHLLGKGLIDNHTVALPGHPGDFLRGAHLFGSLKNDPAENLARSIMRNFGQATSLSRREANKVSAIILQTVLSRKPYMAANFDFWDYQERQCKFIGNSSRVYDFFKIPYQVPLFDKSLFSLMLSLPFSQRLNSVLYNETLESEFFKKHGLFFDLKTPAESGMKSPEWKERIIRKVPMFIKRMYYPDDDPVFYREITEILIKSIPGQTYRRPVKPFRYNTIIIQWYLKWLSMAKYNSRKVG